MVGYIGPKSSGLLAKFTMRNLRYVCIIPIIPARSNNPVDWALPINPARSDYSPVPVVPYANQVLVQFTVRLFLDGE